MGSRLFDLIVATVGLAVASPVLLIAAAGVWLADGSPIVHRATRVGRRGKIFTMYKLRTMRVGAHKASRITAPVDARCFAFGSMLRRLKIDELPQLLNILKGDMALVGPRPEDPKIVSEHYTESQRETLNVAPGLLSPGSLFDYTHGDAFLRSASTEEEYVQTLLPVILALDAVYLRKASLGYNIRLLARTAWVIAGKALGRERFPDPPEMSEALGLMCPSRLSESAGDGRRRRDVPS